MYKEHSLYQELLERVTTVEIMEGGLETWAGNVNNKLDPLDSANLISRCGTLETKVYALETGKSDIGHTHTWASITGKPTLFSGVYSDLTGKPSLFSGSYNDLSNKPTIPSVSTRPNIPDAATNAPTNAANNAPNTAPTDLNVVTTLLGALTGQVNATNARQNQIADIVNANAVKQNAIGTIVVSIAQKLNLNFDALEANHILAAS